MNAPTCPHCGKALYEAEVGIIDDPSQVEPVEETRAGVIDDEEIQQAIFDSVEAGNRPGIAAADAGISKETFYKWKQRGEDQRRRKVRGKYRAFLEKLEAAEDRCEARYVNIVANGAVDDPRLAFDFLKVKFAKDWAQQVNVTINDERSRILEAVLQEFTDEPQIVERLLGRIAGGMGASQVRTVASRSTVDAESGTGDITLAGLEAGDSGPDAVDSDATTDVE
jgi:hypothetical protein